MIKQVSHPVTGVGAADLGLALGVAYALHAPAGRAPEVASRTAKAHRATARGRRRAPARG
ncbi:hypothetical protein [Streptomyces griseus]|uniref:hypothetical protein n=1 Tax=Streptomyces griseus TaxID=1911 RepID=UPI000563C4FB|nr:hypothetical protein [Streptomyces griseus]